MLTQTPLKQRRVGKFYNNKQIVAYTSAEVLFS